MILSGFGLSVVVAYTAFFFNWITLDATKSAVVLGTITFGFGSVWLAFALIFFFISSSLITPGKRMEGVKAGWVPLRSNDPYHNSRRDSYQVWANGFWVAFFCLLWFQFQAEVFLLSAFAVIAVATADTWSTELGSKKSGRTRMITTFEKVKPGTDGGVSLKGTIAALAGSFAISSFLMFQPDPYDTNLVMVVFLAGFTGSVVDSFLGAYLQSKNVNLLKSKRLRGRDEMFKNCLVNWLATGAGGFITLLTIQLLSI